MKSSFRLRKQEKQGLHTAHSYQASDCVIVEASIDPFPCSSPEINGPIQVRKNDAEQPLR